MYIYDRFVENQIKCPLEKLARLKESLNIANFSEEEMLLQKFFMHDLYLKRPDARGKKIEFFLLRTRNWRHKILNCSNIHANFDF